MSVLAISTSSRTRQWIIWFILAFTALEIAVLLLLVILNQLTVRRLIEEYIFYIIPASLSMVGVGSLIAHHRPENRIGWLLSIAGVGLAFAACLQQYARYAMVTLQGNAPLGELAAWLTFWSWIPVTLLFLIFLPLLYPHGRLPSPRWRPIAGIAIFATLLLTLSVAVTPGPIDASLPEVANPLDTPNTRALHRAITLPAQLLILFSLGAAVAAPIIRLRRAQGAERDQLKWFAYAAAILVMGFLIPIIVNLPNFTEDTFLSGLVITFTMPCMPIAVGIAILRYRLYDIDLLINRTLVYTVLTVILLTFYIGTITVLGLISVENRLATSLTATGLVTVLFQPLRMRIQRAINRLLYGEREEPYLVISRLGQQLETTLMPERVLPTIVSTVKDALKLPYTAVAVHRDSGFVIVAEEGKLSGEMLTLPLVYQGESVGQLLVCSRAQGEAWTFAERELLSDLARHAGIAVHGVHVMTELMQARERLVLAREEERRRLRRDLHDDLAPSLAALALTASTAEGLIHSQPEKAAVILSELTSALRSTVSSVRRLAYDLRPPTLDELGLTEAIYEAAVRWNTNGPANTAHITIDIPQPLPEMPAAVEVAIYRIVQEAFMNVQRHAQASACIARLTCVDQRLLECEITDNGIGIPEKINYGVGLRSMQERAVELGGTVELERLSPPGTRITVRLPISREFMSELSNGTNTSHSDCG